MQKGALCEILEWDSSFFGFNVARVLSGRLDPGRVEEILNWCREHAVSCLYFLADADDERTVRMAEETGFRFVDIRVTLNRMLDAVPNGRGSAWTGIRAVRPSDVAGLKEIATAVYKDSRFYFDTGFPPAKADALYAAWIERSCEGSGLADATLVAEGDERAEGYITVKMATPALGRIGLVGVHAEHRGKGVGKALIRAAIEWFRAGGAREVEVVTQGRNVAAQRLYQGCGFRTRSVRLWYHRWFQT